MKKYYYEGHDARGQVVMGEIEAESEGEAAAAIRSVRGHYAREISTSPVKTMYHHQTVAVPKDDQDLEKWAMDEAKKREATAGWEKDEDKKSRKAAKKMAEADAIERMDASFASAHIPLAEPDPRFLEDNLRSNLGEVALALRTIDGWHAQWGEAASKKGQLPPDVPDLGGKTWEFYKDNLNWLGKELMLKAIWSAMNGERLG